MKALFHLIGGVLGIAFPVAIIEIMMHTDEKPIASRVYIALGLCIIMNGWNAVCAAAAPRELRP